MLVSGRVTGALRIPSWDFELVSWSRYVFSRLLMEKKPWDRKKNAMEQFKMPFKRGVFGLPVDIYKCTY